MGIRCETLTDRQLEIATKLCSCSILTYSAVIGHTHNAETLHTHNAQCSCVYSTAKLSNKKGTQLLRDNLREGQFMVPCMRPNHIMFRHSMD